MMHCIYTKFHETILKGLRVIEQTQFVMDRQKDGQMYVQTDRHLWRKQYVLPQMGGDINLRETQQKSTLH